MGIDVELKRLDPQSSAKLFLKRVRRPLRKDDFRDFGFQHESPQSPRNHGTSRNVFQAHMTALLQHPVMQTLGGHPARIREAAEKVTDTLPSIYTLLENTESPEVMHNSSFRDRKHVTMCGESQYVTTCALQRRRKPECF